MRYISISCCNSLFWGSNAGAQRLATLYSLAISSRLNNVNTFSYFKHIILCLAMNKALDKEKNGNLLPDKWLKY